MMKRLFRILSLLLLALPALSFLGACGSGPEPVASATAPSAPSPTPSSTPSPTPSRTLSPTPSSTRSPTRTRTESLSRDGAIPIYSYRIVNVYPHDPLAWTQGLVFEDGVLLESTGRRGQSSLRRVALESGEVLQFLALPPQLFAEGLTLFGDRIIQLTLKARVGFVYDADSFALQRTFIYPTEGWGLTHDGQRLIMSDGTAALHFLDPDTLLETGRIEVHDDQGPVTMLNELEYIEGEVYANVWLTDRIARIDPDSGQVTAWIDLAGLLSPEDFAGTVDVLNGIAYDAQNGRLFVTGKLWPKLFEIELVAPD
jgi:glutamine cyclotransferase